MPRLDKRLTDTLARNLPVPDKKLNAFGDLVDAYVIHYCKDDPGFGVRITSNGDRAWILERRVEGKTKRRTLGKVVGAGAITAAAAREIKINTSSELQKGIDRVVERRQQAEQDKAQAVTLREALSEYVKKKRRGKDGLALKERTQADYLRMLDAPRELANGELTAGGELHTLADRSIYKISGADVRELHGKLMKRGERRAAYAMQVLRAVFRWHGVIMPDDPMGRDVAGKDRIVIPQARAGGKAIPAEQIGAWWHAALAHGTATADLLMFTLLTGARITETAGDAYADGILVRDVDLPGARVTLPDTKNRRDHTILLSRQALEIVKRNMKGKGPRAKLFGAVDTRVTLATINKAAGIKVAVTPKSLRKTFATLADELVPGYALKAMVNHANTGDVTGAHYVKKGEAALRAGWQAVADFIESCVENEIIDLV